MTSSPDRWKVLVTAARACQDIERYQLALGAAGCTVTAHSATERLSESQILPLLADVDALVCGDDRITPRVLDAAPRLKVIAKWGTGIDSIDVDAAQQRGVQVANTPDAFTDAVADTVMGYILLFARGLDRMDQDIRAGRWQHRQLRTLAECTLGIVGLGNIGTAVAQRAQAFRMSIVGCDIRPTASRSAAAIGVRLLSFERVLAESDFLTLHADLRPENRGLLNAQRLASMRPSAVLINTARGPMIDEAALVAALTEGRLAGAALDVFDTEPLPAVSPLRGLRNVYLAPHNSNSSAAAADRVHENTIRNVLHVLGAQSQ